MVFNVKIATSLCKFRCIFLHFLLAKNKHLPNLDMTDENALDQLLPWSTTLPVACIAFNKLPK
jgi:transposase